MKLKSKEWGMTVWFEDDVLFGQHEGEDEFQFEFIDLPGQQSLINEIEEFFKIELIHVGSEMDGSWRKKS